MSFLFIEEIASTPEKTTENFIRIIEMNILKRQFT